jgi:repressor LexA
MEFLTTFQESHGYSPSIRQIGDSIGVKSTSLVDYYLQQLTEMGYIQREQHVSRSIRIQRPMFPIQQNGLVDRTVASLRSALDELLTIPVWGPIGASFDFEIPESDVAPFDAESTVDVALSLLPAREKLSELYALRVKGESMIDAMVNDGDIVILRRSAEANNGDMVAVWLEDEHETTLKYFYKTKTGITLVPANPTMQPKVVKNPSQLRIKGKVVMVIRQVHSKGSLV